MDHYCPWIGGMVSESSFKFFVQFTGSAALYCLVTMIIAAIALAMQVRASAPINGNIIATLVLAAFFFIFTGGMFGVSLESALLNITQVENIDRKTKVRWFAVYLPEGVSLLDLREPSKVTYRTITFDGTRTFAILKTNPGENPWDVGHYTNFQMVMGRTVLQWFNPLQPSPLREDCIYSRYLANTSQLCKRYNIVAPETRLYGQRDRARPELRNHIMNHESIIRYPSVAYLHS